MSLNLKNNILSLIPKKAKISGKIFLKLQSRDRKSTRLNSSHQIISYAVFCLKKKMIDVVPGKPPPDVEVGISFLKVRACAVVRMSSVGNEIRAVAGGDNGVGPDEDGGGCAPV